MPSQDIKDALRSLWRSPGYTLAAALTLALGIGANTAIFSVINDVLLRDLPYAEPGRLVMAWEHHTKRGRLMNVVSPANFLDWRDSSTSFESMAGFYDRSFTLTGDGDPEQVMASGVTPNLFDILGAHAQLGRVLSQDDERPDSPLSVVLSHSYWLKRFGGDPAIIGRKITLTGTDSTVVGVMPMDFGFYVKEASFNSAPPDLWVQARFDASSRIRKGRFMAVLARLKPNVTLDQAQAEMKSIAAGLEQQYQEFNKDWTVNLVPLRQQITGDIGPALLIVFGAVCLTLFIACANVANLQLVRASARSREVTVRAALGASRSHFIRLLLTENILVALLGGLGGLGLGSWGLATLQTLMPRDLLPGDYIGLDARVFGFAALLSLLAGLASGLIPALIASRPRLAEALKEGSRGTTSATGRRLRQAFVTAQIALALVVVVGAGLLVRSFDGLVAADVGFDTHNLLTARVTLPGSTYDSVDRVQAFYQELISRLEALPGVLSATGTVFAPFAGPGAATSFEIVGRPTPVGEKPSTDVRVVGANYFTTLRIPLLLGRTFAPEEMAHRRDVVIISEALARRQFPGRNPIGEKLVINMRDPNTPSEVIGVVGDIRHRSLDEAPREMVYWPHTELPISMMTLLVRTQNDPLQLAPSLQREVRALDRNLPVPEPRTMDQLVAGTVVRARFATVLFSLFATLALILAALGIYGVISYQVALETRDIGVRMALGANRSQVVREILGDGSRLAAVGVMVGVAGAVGLTRLLTSQLYEVTATDPATFLLTSGGLMLIAVIACWLPARRAAAVDPIEALRQD